MAITTALSRFLFSILDNRTLIPGSVSAKVTTLAPVSSIRDFYLPKDDLIS